MHANAEAHAAAGRHVETPAGRVFVREDGAANGGTPVVLLHGVPVSSYVWRPVLPLLAGAGLHAVAPDFPGLGLSDRPDPDDFDYSFQGLHVALEQTLDALGIARAHLVVHDIGGPIGFLLAARAPERIASLTVLNTWVDLDTHRKPWPMWLFTKPGVDKATVAAMTAPTAWALLQQVGVKRLRAIGLGDAAAIVDLLRHADGGRAFLAIMRGFEQSPAVRRELEEALARRAYPAAVVWGRHDPAIGAARAAHLAGLLHCGEPAFLDAKHFLMLDQPAAVADAIARTAHAAA
ncbi:MAG TPA: alpha/beta fold hydrolase [Egibacteraceae bacterium]|nr:alpha/beta fold hydrolase [Egibacteraceae bacterium]